MGSRRRHARPCRVRRLRRGGQPVGRGHRRQALDDRIQSRIVVEPTAGDGAAGQHDGHRSSTSRRSSSRARQSVGTAIVATNGSTSSPLRGDDFLSDLCQQWEAATAAAEKECIRTVHLRTGIVLSAQRRGAEEATAAVQARPRRKVRQRPSVAELDIDRRRCRGHLPPVVVRDLRSGQPDCARTRSPTSSSHRCSPRRCIARRSCPSRRSARSCSWDANWSSPCCSADNECCPPCCSAMASSSSTRRSMLRSTPCCTIRTANSYVSVLLVGGVDGRPTSQFGIEIEPFGGWPGRPVLPGTAHITSNSMPSGSAAYRLLLTPWSLSPSSEPAAINLARSFASSSIVLTCQARWYRPGECAAGLGRSADSEQAEIMVVRGAIGTQERCLRAHGGHRFEPEHVRVELGGPLRVAHPQDCVVESPDHWSGLYGLGVDLDLDLVADHHATRLEDHVEIQAPFLAADLGLGREPGACAAPRVG